MSQLGYLEGPHFVGTTAQKKVALRYLFCCYVARFGRFRKGLLHEKELWVVNQSGKMRILNCLGSLFCERLISLLPGRTCTQNLLLIKVFWSPIGTTELEYGPHHFFPNKGKQIFQPFSTHLFHGKTEISSPIPKQNRSLVGWCLTHTFHRFPKRPKDLG